MDKKYLEEKSLLESVGRYKTILEYISLGGDLNEDGENPMGPDAGIEGMPPAPPAPADGAPADPGMGGAPQGPDTMGPDAGAQGMPDAGADPQGGDAMGPQGGVEGFEPQGEDPGMNPEMEPVEEPEEDDEEVIDVDELTDSQEDTEKKVGKLSAKFDRLMSMLDNLEANLDANSQQISGLKDEMEKRNPTPEEKLSLRSKDGYPFNVSVDDYWKDKEATSGYSTEDDMNGEDSPIYKITKSDIDSITDWPSISKSLDDDSFHMNLKDIMGV